MVCAVEIGISLVVVRAKEGVFLAFVPQDLDAAEVDGAFKELGVTPCQVCEISDWQVSSVRLSVAKLPWAGDK